MRLRLRRAAHAAALAAVLLSCSDGALAPDGGAPTLDLHGIPDAPPMITEIMANPDGGDDTVAEWFEVYNPGDLAVNLGGWRITSGPTGSETHVIAGSLVVPSRGFAVIGRNTDRTVNGDTPVDYATPGNTIQLNNSNTDWITLKRPVGAAMVLVDSVAYAIRTGTTVAPFTPPQGASLQVVNVSVDNTIVGENPNWRVAEADEEYGRGDWGTPGAGDYGPVYPAGPVAAVNLAPSPAYALPGANRQLVAAALDADGRSASSTFTWASSNTAVARVSTSGLVSAVTLGTATITATAANGVVGSVVFTVAAAGTPVRVTLSINSPRRAPVGYTKPAFTSAVGANDATVSNVSYTWTSSDPSVATVDGLGYITGVGVGTTTITATTANGVSGSRDFTVIPAEPASSPARYRDHTEFGVPSDATPDDEIPVARREFTASYNAARGGPSWVSWHINFSQFGRAPRCDCFTTDRSLPAGVVPVTDFHYRNGGYDRGHMVQSESRTATDQENAATFLLSNILPQANANNGGPWLRFELFLDDLARLEHKEVYVVAGGLYAATPPTLKNEGRVAIPDYTWKVAVVIDADRGIGDVAKAADVQVYAVKMPNLLGAHAAANPAASAVGINNRPWEDYRTTVDAIEAAVGYDVFALLPDKIERVVESGTRAPTAVIASAPARGLEGSVLPFSAAGSSDPDGDGITYRWSFGDGTTADGPTPAHAFGDEGMYTVTLTVEDEFGAEGTATTIVVVENVAPTIATFDVATAPARAGAPVAASVTFADPGDDLVAVTFAWGDGPSSPVSGRARAADAAHASAAPGLYHVTVTVNDGDGGTAVRRSAGYVVVYDPAAGFVTGGGWTDGSEGSGRGSRKGRAHFTVTARYGAGDAPEGMLNLRLRGEQIELKTDRFAWLVVEGTEARLRGAGTIDGVGQVEFLLVVHDAGPGGEGDRVRIRAWRAGSEGDVLFDGAPDQPDESDQAPALGGGNVTVHGR
ncbi:MAG TPA: DNA/RNA non-specific endonuclease [Gemmatimonadaceae bacterium]|nr:DNA/RNA non-specific endonuclease [Gemmatimonadaceae bacterium]